MKRLFRKYFEHEYETLETVKNFSMHPVLFSGEVVESSFSKDEKGFWVYLTVKGEFDPEEFFQATGYKLVV